MLILEILMIVIGLGAVIISFKMADKSESKKSNKEVYSSEGKGEIYSEIEKIIEEKADEVMVQTDDKLSAISNDKIIAISEYSDQVLDKMENNHAEVVFLYNMLNEKEKEIKNLVHEVDVAKAEVRDEIAKGYEESQNAYSSSMEEFELSTAKSVYDDEIARIEQAERVNQMLDDMYLSREEVEETSPITFSAQIQEDKQEEEIENHNDTILRLYKEGKSIMEISKQLMLGQGEVKFVIDLYETSK